MGIEGNSHNNDVKEPIVERPESSPKNVDKEQHKNLGDKLDRFKEGARENLDKIKDHLKDNRSELTFENGTKQNAEQKAAKKNPDASSARAETARATPKAENSVKVESVKTGKVEAQTEKKAEQALTRSVEKVEAKAKHNETASNLDNGRIKKKPENQTRSEKPSSEMKTPEQHSEVSSASKNGEKTDSQSKRAKDLDQGNKKQEAKQEKPSDVRAAETQPSKGPEQNSEVAQEKKNSEKFDEKKPLEEAENKTMMKEITNPEAPSRTAEQKNTANAEHAETRKNLDNPPKREEAKADSYNQSELKSREGAESKQSETNGGKVKLEDLSYDQIHEMVQTPEGVSKLNEANADFRERYEAEIRGMSVDEYQDHKDKLDAEKSKSEMKDDVKTSETAETKDIDKRFEDVTERINVNEENYKKGFKDRTSEEKALGANLTTMSDIHDARGDIAKEKDGVTERLETLRKENPYYNKETNQEYKELCGRYEKLESQDKKLAAYESTLDGRNYAMVEELNATKGKGEPELAYFQQTENYRYGKSGMDESYYSFENQYSRSMDSVEDYAKKLEGKISSGDTSALDKFGLDFQRSRIDDALSRAKENGTPAEKERAEALSTRLDNAQKELGKTYEGFKLHTDGTVHQKTETHSSVKDFKTVDNTNNPTIDKHGNEVTKKLDVSLGAYDSVTKSESTLYTGRKVSESKETTFDFARANGEVTKTHNDANGEKVVDTKKIESSAGHITTKRGYDLDKGTAFIKGEASAAHLKGVHERSVGDDKETTEATFNIGRTYAEGKIDTSSLSMSVKAGRDVGDAELKHEVEKDGHKLTTTATGELFGKRSSLEMDKYGAKVSEKSHYANGSIEMKLDGAELFSIKPDKAIGEIKATPVDKELSKVENALEGLEKSTDIKSSYEKAEREHNKPKSPEFKTKSDVSRIEQINTENEDNVSNNEHRGGLFGRIKDKVTSAESKISEHLKDNTGEVSLVKDGELPACFDGLSEEAKVKQYEALDKMSDEEKKAYFTIIEKEPAITADVQDASKKNGGELQGLEYRVKTPFSTYEKMHEREEKTDIGEMKDVIRYTEIYPPDKLAEGTNASLRDFESRGYTVDRVKNTWDDENTAYRGINANLTSPDGQTFEVQFHTKESFELKNGKLHSLYEERRTMADNDPRAAELDDRMSELSSKLERPDKIDEVKNQ